MEKKLLELAVGIVQAQASMVKMSPEEIDLALMRVYNALHKMRLAEQEGRSLMPGDTIMQIPMQARSTELDPRSSIQEDKVTCMECKAEFRQITANHLRSHQLTPREYKKKWGFQLKQPLAAKALTRLRSRSAKKRGLPENLQLYLEKKKGLRAPTSWNSTTQNTLRSGSPSGGSA